MTELRKKVTNSIKWSAIERLLTQLIQLSIMLVLARMLGPEAFGLVGMLAVFIAISQVFVDSGFTSALIRKQDRTEEDFSTAFIINIVISVVVYSLLFLLSPYIASFYEQPELSSITRVLGIVVIINALSLVQKAKLTIEMDFKNLAKASLLSVLFSSTVAITLAYKGFGVWSLVFQTIIMAASNVILLNIFRPWKPKVQYSQASFSHLFGFGSKLLVSSLIDTVYKNIYQIIIGKQFTATQVGQFTQANQLSSIPAMTLTNVIQRVTYPMLSQMQDDHAQLEKSYLLTLKLAALVVFPLMFGLAFVSEPLLLVLVGADWLPAAQLVSILAIGFMLYPIHAINLNLLQVKGRSDLFLKLEIVKKLMTTIILFFTVPLGVKAMCIGLVLQSHLSLIVNTYYTGKLTSLSLKKQLTSLIPIWGVSGLSCYLGWIISNKALDNNLLVVLSAVCLSIVFYLVVVKIVFKSLFEYIYTAISRKAI